LAYAVPFESSCVDGRDNDCNGFVDCDDPVCATEPPCADVLYGIPFEDCCDGVDNDGDGAADCADDECTISYCMVAYGIPFEGDCEDGRDGDCDGLVDCDDPECACDMPVYAAPF
jgi:hypothetical protein